jgi:hypothetical protein
MLSLNAFPIRMIWGNESFVAILRSGRLRYVPRTCFRSATLPICCSSLGHCPQLCLVSLRVLSAAKRRRLAGQPRWMDSLACPRDWARLPGGALQTKPLAAPRARLSQIRGAIVVAGAHGRRLLRCDTHGQFLERVGQWGRRAGMRTAESLPIELQ